MYRSPIAAAALIQRLKQDGIIDRWNISSAGTWTESGKPIPTETIHAANKFGLNLAGYETRMITEDDISNHNLILVMESSHREALLSEFVSARGKVFLLSEAAGRLAYNIADPAKGDIGIEQACQEIYELINTGYVFICRLATQM